MQPYEHGLKSQHVHILFHLNMNYYAIYALNTQHICVSFGSIGLGDGCENDGNLALARDCWQ